jgi:hypothetical protein
MQMNILRNFMSFLSFILITCGAIQIFQGNTQPGVIMLIFGFLWSIDNKVDLILERDKKMYDAYKIALSQIAKEIAANTDKENGNKNS